MKANAPISETGIVIAGISVLRQRLQEHEDDDDDEHDRLDQRLQHFANRVADDLVVSSAIWYCEPGGKFFASRIELRT